MIEKNEMIFGVRAVIEAIQAGKEIDKVLVKKDIQSDLSKELFAVLKKTFIPVQRVPVERINTRTKPQVIALISLLPTSVREHCALSCLNKKRIVADRMNGQADVRNRSHCTCGKDVPGGCYYYRTK